MIALSVVIITYNEERNLGRCLESVQRIADDIVVVDSASTDETVAIALRHGARVVQHAFAGYGQQKNFAAAQAAHDWVLSLDADEAVTPELERSILEMKQGPKYDVYEMPRVTNYCGQWIWHCGWYPDRQTRLFNRTKGRWEERMVHEFWRADDPAAPRGLLAGNLLHYSFATIAEHQRKIAKYSELGARDAAARGKRVGLLKLLFYPPWKFVLEYVFRLGFLDGYYGYIICKLSAAAAYQKYVLTRRYSRA